MGRQRGRDILGSEGEDEIFGTEKGDTILGLGGNDLLIGGAGSDKLLGGDGDDLLMGADLETGMADSGRRGLNLLNGEAGNDILIGGHGRDALIGGPGNDLLDGLGGDDVLVGDGGADILAYHLLVPDAGRIRGGEDLITDFEPVADTLALVFELPAGSTTELRLAELLDTDRDGVLGLGDRYVDFIRVDGVTSLRLDVGSLAHEALFGHGLDGPSAWSVTLAGITEVATAAVVVELVA